MLNNVFEMASIVLSLLLVPAVIVQWVLYSRFVQVMKERKPELWKRLEDLSVGYGVASTSSPKIRFISEKQYLSVADGELQSLCSNVLASMYVFVGLFVGAVLLQVASAIVRVMS